MWHTQKAAGAGQLTFLPQTAPVVTWYMSCSSVEEIWEIRMAFRFTEK